MNVTRNPIILDKPEDWPTWIEEITGSIPDETWVLIDPDVETHNDFLQKPLRPRIEEVNAEKTTYVELTATERNVHDQLFKHYQEAMKQYDRETKGLQDAKNLIRSRVSNAKSLLLKGKDTARAWLTTLKTATSASKGFISYQAAQKYEASIRKAPTTATVSKWLATWEQAMAEAIKHDIPEISAGRWLRDLARAIRPISDALYVKFVNAATDDEKSKPERYLTVSMKIREIVQTDTSKRTVMRGNAFAAEFDGEAAPDNRNIHDHHDEANNNTKTRKRPWTTSAPDNPIKKRIIGCKACGKLRHKLPRCYYAFPEIRPLGFEPNEELVEKVARVLQNGDLNKEIEAIRKERGNKPL